MKKSFSNDRIHLVSICSLNLLTDSLYYTLCTYYIHGMEVYLKKQSEAVTACMAMKSFSNSVLFLFFLTTPSHPVCSQEAAGHSVNVGHNSARLNSSAYSQPVTIFQSLMSSLKKMKPNSTFTVVWEPSLNSTKNKKYIFKSNIWNISLKVFD